jgi:hypothetical protein
MASAAAAPIVAANQTPSVKATHKIYTVLLTPSNVAGTVADASQSATKVASTITSQSSYWSRQSSGVVKFANAGVSTWSKSTFSCDPTTGNQTALQNEAISIATSQLGYEKATNNHLLVVLPATVTTECGALSTTATLGTSVNTGGIVWNVGSDSAAAKAALTKGLGRNLSLGTASWLNCSAAAPTLANYDTTGCTVVAGGDQYDAMGTAIAGKNGGAISSASAIRSGLWTTSAYTVAPQGTTSYTLKPVGAGSGKRAVVVQGLDGINYYVEFRNFSGSDAVSGTPCTAAGCVPTAPGVRILRVESPLVGGVRTKGAAGDATYLIGRTVSSVPKVNYVAGESFSPGAASGITVTVSSIATTKSATVSVVRPTNAVTVGTLKAFAATDLDGNPATVQVGDTWSTTLGSTWEADSYLFEWKREGVKIPSATKASYTLTSTDIGKHITVSVVGLSKTVKSAVVTDATSYGPVTEGVLDNGNVLVAASGKKLAVTTTGYTTPGTKFAYQWYRGGVAIAKATESKFLPTSADSNTLFSVKVTASRTGFNTLSTTTAGKDFVTEYSGSLAITGTRAVGNILSVNTLNYSTVAGAVASPVRTYQWYRGTSKISGATAQTYTLASGDYGKSLTVKVTGGLAGNFNPTVTSPASGTIAKGTFAGSLALPVITATTSSGVISLTASLAAGTITTASPTVKYQWYRNGVAIPSGQSATFKPVASDFDKSLSVKATITKTNYNAMALTTVGKVFTVTTAAVPTITGTVKVGQTLTATAPSYKIDNVTYVPTGSNLTYQWLADGVAVTSATNATFVVPTGYAGKIITVTVTAKQTGHFSSVTTSAPTVAVVA